MSIEISVKSEQDKIEVSVGNIKAILTQKQAETLYKKLYKQLVERALYTTKSQFDGQDLWD